jgi:hypothetical protein
MIRTLLAAAAIAFAAPALADPMPPAYLGYWCTDAGADAKPVIGFEKCTRKEAAYEDGLSLKIEPTRFVYGGDNCPITSIRKTGDAYPMSTKPRAGEYPNGDWVSEVIVMGKCGQERFKYRLHWLKGGGLTVTDLYLVD